MKIVRADSHVDTIELSMNKSLCLEDRKLSFNLTDVKDYLPYIQCMACFIHDKYSSEGYERVNNLLSHYYNEIKDSNVITIRNSKDIEHAIIENKLGILLTIENGIALDKKIDNIYTLYEKGIRMMSLTWNGDNELGSGAFTSHDNGLTCLGKKCINAMNNINMIIDISHASTKTFWDIMGMTRKPVIATHSNVYAICKNKRNLSDFQIKEIAKSKGIIGINYCTKFLTDRKNSSVQDVINHIKYVCDLVGTEYVCLGSDFDGIEKESLPDNLKGIKDIYKLEECMLYNGFTKENIQDIMGRNLVRFLKDNL